MENNPEAAVTPEVKTEAQPTNTNQETQAPAAPAQPDMHGFTSDQLADMKKFFEANGGFDKIKAKISNPEPKVEQNVMNAPTTTGVNAAIQTTGIKAAQQVQAQQTPQQPQQQQQIDGSIRMNEWIAKQYFEGFANDPKYKQVFAEKSTNDLAKEMAGFNVFLTNMDGSINDKGVRAYLDMKAETIAAHQTAVTPVESSSAPTIDYVPVGDSINNITEARAVLMQDSQLKRSGQAGHPKAQLAEEFLKKSLERKA